LFIRGPQDPGNFPTGTVRISLGCFNTYDDIETLIQTIIKLCGREIESMENRLSDIERHENMHEELDRFLEEKKKEIMHVFSQDEDFSLGSGI
jgi:hypothetical protein